MENPSRGCLIQSQVMTIPATPKYPLPTIVFQKPPCRLFHEDKVSPVYTGEGGGGPPILDGIPSVTRFARFLPELKYNIKKEKHGAEK